MIKIGTIFSGIGSPEFALKNIGVEHRLVFACDNNRNVKKTYMQNHNTKYFFDDVLDMCEMTEIPKMDLFVFGFPCQPFSISGHSLGFDDIRGKLFYSGIEIIKNTKPKFFIAENVAGIKRHGWLDKIYESLDSLNGYSFTYFKLNALDFGIPQHRERIWFIGVKEDNISQYIDKIDKYKTPYKSLSHILNKSYDKSYYATKSFLQKPEVKELLKKYDKDYINCITMSISRNGSSSEYKNYVAAVYKAIRQKRKPTINECIKLFGLPNTFRFPTDVSRTAQYNMLANTMVVPMIEAILRSLFERI